MTAHAVVYSPIAQASRSEQVVERLNNAIVAGLLHPNEQLPNESELSRLMGVSPVTIRDALNTLRSRQLIDTRRGRNGGSFVCPVPVSAWLEHHPLRQISTGDLADLGEYHCAIISHSAGLATQRATPTDQKKLAALIDQFESMTHAEARTQLDMRCLLVLTTTAQSPRLANQELTIQAEWAPLVMALYADSAVHTKVVHAYRAIQTALEESNESGACTHARAMLASLTERLLALRFRMDTESPAAHS
ncbi:FadR family transcriptional regulator [Allopusillimonas ginsengisoli]|nr:FadR family transcriptional regulator [Allopusillimonas ginsengisoli]